jgi:hypothetical protein
MRGCSGLQASLGWTCFCQCSGGVRAQGPPAAAGEMMLTERCLPSWWCSIQIRTTGTHYYWCYLFTRLWQSVRKTTAAHIKTVGRDCLAARQSPIQPEFTHPHKQTPQSKQWHPQLLAQLQHLSGLDRRMLIQVAVCIRGTTGSQCGTQSQSQTSRLLQGVQMTLHPESSPSMELLQVKVTFTTLPQCDHLACRAPGAPRRPRASAGAPARKKKYTTGKRPQCTASSSSLPQEGSRPNDHNQPYSPAIHLPRSQD